ncbi:hypothetical protein [Streptomyces bohaiensis]|uniref:hypothetical protein n=1 Tax=Streptomyces bohaiensis TaxID=1431344 RepID=UPI003B827494
MIISDREFPVTGEATIEVVVTAETEEAARDILCKRGGEKFHFQDFITHTGHTLKACEIDYIGAGDAQLTETHAPQYTFEAPGFLGCTITALTVGEAAHRYEHDIEGEDYSSNYTSGPILITKITAQDHWPYS